MPQSFYGSLCLTDLIEKAKTKHSGFTKGKNGKIYASIGVWLNDSEDEYGNVMSIKVNPSKEKKEAEKGFYVGNCKQSKNDSKPISDRDASGLDVALDIAPAQNSDISPKDDLPF
jgi:hypothetical protein